MWGGANSINLTMVEGDYGITLPIVISGATIDAGDTLKFTFKRRANYDSVILEKTYTGITDNTVQFSFTQAESALFPVGSYVFSLDWYKGTQFQSCIVPSGSFNVGDKA